MHRRQNFQTVSWFFDLSQRDRLDLDPPYQRRSVWNQSFKDYFVDTVLLGLPAPAIFLFEEISPEGRSVYHVVDGKQRLTTLLEFVSDAFRFPTTARADSEQARIFRHYHLKQRRTSGVIRFSWSMCPRATKDSSTGSLIVSTVTWRSLPRRSFVTRN